MVDEIAMVGGWGCFVDARRFEDVSAIVPREGSPEPWVLFLPPNVMAILFADFFWNAVNGAVGTLLDRGEEEDIDPSQSLKVADAMGRLAAERYASGTIERAVGWRNDGTPIVTALPAPELLRQVMNAVAFLRSAAEQGWQVVVSF